MYILCMIYMVDYAKLLHSFYEGFIGFEIWIQFCHIAIMTIIIQAETASKSDVSNKIKLYIYIYVL